MWQRRTLSPNHILNWSALRPVLSHLPYCAQKELTVDDETGSNVTAVVSLLLNARKPSGPTAVSWVHTVSLSSDRVLWVSPVFLSALSSMNHCLLISSEWSSYSFLWLQHMIKCKENSIWLTIINPWKWKFITCIFLNIIKGLGTWKIWKFFIIFRGCLSTQSIVKLEILD